MRDKLLARAVQTALPFILGALGGWAAVAFPSYQQAFCSGGLL